MNSLVSFHFHPSGQVWGTAASEQMAFYKAFVWKQPPTCLCTTFWVGGGGGVDLDSYDHRLYV